MAKTATPTVLSFETLPQARAKTEAAATFLEQKLQTYVDALRLLMAPQRALGRFVGGRTPSGMPSGPIISSVSSFEPSVRRLD